MAAATSAVTAAMVVAVAWVVGWPGETPPPTAIPQTNTSAIDMLASRVSDLEERSAKPAGRTGPGAARADRRAGEIRCVAAHRDRRHSRAVGETGGRTQCGEIGAARSRFARSCRDQRTPQPDRTCQRAESAEIAQAANKPADDTALRRVVAASMLDVSVRQGEPFVAALAAAKALAPDPEALKPLDVFAASGVPNAASLCRELLTLVPKLSPPAPENATTGTGIVDRLQAGAAKLVRIERTDAVGNDRSAVVARVTAAALRNDLAEARRELNTLAPADRAAAQAWLDKANERDAALARLASFRDRGHGGARQAGAAHAAQHTPAQ